MKSRACAVLIGSVLMMQAALSQHTSGRWALGLAAEGNFWLTDMNTLRPGVGGILTGRYGLSRNFSLGFQFGYTALKSAQEPITPEKPNSYLKLNATPIVLAGWWHLLPARRVAPYVFIGAGLMRYTRRDGARQYQPDAADRVSFYVPAGVGVELFTTQALSVDLSGSYTVLHRTTDLLRIRKTDGIAAVRVGLTLYTGSSDDDDDDADGLTRAEERELRTNPTNPDTDEDGLRDGAEVKRLKTDPLNPDSDGDMLKDGDEVYLYFTDPLNPDSDGDGFSDFEEVKAGSDPLDHESHPPR